MEKQTSLGQTSLDWDLFHTFCSCLQNGNTLFLTRFSSSISVDLSMLLIITFCISQNYKHNQNFNTYKYFRIIHYSYLCCKNCFIATNQNSKHFPNLIEKCLGVQHNVEFSVIIKVPRSKVKGNLCMHCWRFPETFKHDIPYLLLKKILSSHLK